MSISISRELSKNLPRLRRFAFGLSGDYDLADDLVQGACERALTRLSQWDESVAIDHWLFRTIRNLYIDHIRHQQVVDKHQRVKQPELSLVVNGEAVMEKEFLMDDMQQALSTLSNDHRSILLLVCAEGYSYKEVSEILELPMGTVTSRLARARSKVLEQMVLSDTGHLD